ncbi:hypothetical protein K523DRAFT_381833 [Schizophyllum commune Tattone D]|nr:hypothetical protein K523DRAFT_381833 [Schizophyllum commune Tattone D]
MDRARDLQQVLLQAFHDALKDPGFRQYNRIASPGSTFRRGRPREGNLVDYEAMQVATEEVDPVLSGYEVEDPIEEEAEALVASSSKPKPNSGLRARDVPETSWPKGRTEKGYKFERDDSVASPRPPKGGCYICTSPRHYAMDCPHFNQWKRLYRINLVDRQVALATIQEQDNEYEAMFTEWLQQSESSAYAVCDRDETSTMSASDSESPFDYSSATEGEYSSDSSGGLFHLPQPRNAARRRADPRFNAKKQKTKSAASKGKEAMMATEGSNTIPRRIRRLPRRRLTDVIYEATKARNAPEGLSSSGVRALHMPVWLRSLNSTPTDGRLDSGADITLLSAQHYESWPEDERPVLKEGPRMKLYHLTGQTKVLGYVKFPLFAEAEDGSWVRFEVEAYVVQGMQVPLLLGEDFQTTYELGVRRSASGNCKIDVGSSGKVLAASSARATSPGFKIRRANSARTFRLPKTKAGVRARSRRFPGGLPEVVAAQDVVLEPQAVHNVPVTGPFEGRSDWLVEKVAIGGMDASLMASPTTWIQLMS